MRAAIPRTAYNARRRRTRREASTPTPPSVATAGWIPVQPGNNPVDGPGGWGSLTCDQACEPELPTAGTSSVGNIVGSADAGPSILGITGSEGTVGASAFSAER